MVVWYEITKWVNKCTIYLCLSFWSGCLTYVSSSWDLRIKNSWGFSIVFINTFVVFQLHAQTVSFLFYLITSRSDIPQNGNVHENSTKYFQDNPSFLLIFGCPPSLFTHFFDNLGALKHITSHKHIAISYKLECLNKRH